MQGFLHFVFAIFWCKHANEYIFDISGPEGSEESTERHSEITGIFLKVRVYATLLAQVPSGFFFIEVMGVVLSKHSLLRPAEYIYIG